MQILPYNRVLKDLNDWTPEQLLEILGTVFAIDPDGKAQPARKHELGLYLQGKWHTLAFRIKLIAAATTRWIRSTCRCCRNTSCAGFRH